MSPVCPEHPDGAVEGCEACGTRDHDDDEVWTDDDEAWANDAEVVTEDEAYPSPRLKPEPSRPIPVVRPRAPRSRRGVPVVLWLVGGWIVLVGLGFAAGLAAVVAKAAPGSVPWMVGALASVTVVGLIATVWGAAVRRRRAQAWELSRDRELATAWDWFSRVLETPGMVLMEVRGADQHPNGSYAIVQPVEVDGLTWTEVWFDRIPVHAPLWVAVSPVRADKPGHWPAQWLHVDTIPAWVTHEAAAAWWRDRARQEASARTSGRKPAPAV